jgi:hypothetical protein
MCKKLMFLISLVYLLGVASSALAANLEVDWPDVYVVSGVEEYDEINCGGKIIIPAGAELIMNDESRIDGNGDDGEGGDGATILVDGGTFTMRNRINMGTDHDAFMIVDGGGTITHTGDKVTIPDNSGGMHRLIILDGTCTMDECEVIPDRDSAVIVGCLGTLTTCNTGSDSRRPSWWLTQTTSGGPGAGEPALQCEEGCELAGGTLIITDLGGNCEEVICFLSTPSPYGPGPKDGAVGEAAVTCDMVLTWNEGNCLGTKGRNFVYFGTDCDAVANSPNPSEGGFPGPEYQGQTFVGTTSFNVGPLPLWTNYCWRIDQGCQDGSIVEGPLWTFTTGCPLIEGDANLDCVVNFVDYAMVASTWMGEQFFPEGFTP